jgi:hypothetical protein
MASALAITPAKVGAPTEYRPEYCRLMLEFFESRPLGLRRIGNDADSAVEPRTVCSEVPTFQGFARTLQVTHKCLIGWSRNYREFGEAYARCKEMQEQFFGVGLTTGTMNPTGGIFVAKNMLGWTDKKEVEIVSSADSANQASMRDALAAATPDELAQIAALFATLEARAKLARIEQP